MRPSTSTILLLIVLLIERINCFGFLGFGGSAVKETSTSADILKHKLKTRCSSVPTFPVKVQKFIHSCQSEIKTNLVDDLIFAAVHENPFKDHKDRDTNEHILKFLEGFGNGEKHYGDHSHNDHHASEHDSHPDYVENHQHSPEVYYPSKDYHSSNSYHTPDTSQYPSHDLHPPTHDLNYPSFPPYPPNHESIHQSHEPHHSSLPLSHDSSHHASPHHSSLPLSHDPSHHSSLPLSHDSSPHHSSLSHDSNPHSSPHHSPPPLSHDSIQHSSPHHSSDLSHITSHDSRLPANIHSPADAHQTLAYYIGLAGKLQNANQKLNDKSNLKWHRRSKRGIFFGKSIQHDDKDDDHHHHHSKLISHEDQWLAGCLMQCIFRKNNAVDKKGFPTLDGVVELFTDGIHEHAFFMHTLRAVDKCLKGASIKHHIYNGKDPVKGQTCDVAFDIFDCVSDSITEYCNSH